MKQLFSVVIATGLIFAISCKKEVSMKPDTPTTVFTKNTITLGVKEASKLVKDLNLQISLVQQIDTSLTNGYIRGEISEDVLFEKLPSDLQFKFIDATDLLNEDFTNLKIKYKTESLKNIDWNKSFLDKRVISKLGNYGIIYSNRTGDCDNEYSVSSAYNLATFAADATTCVTLVEVPPLAAACVLGAAAYYAYQQQNTVNDYYDCIGG